MGYLGVYWSVEHRRKQDYDYFNNLHPSVFKIMDGGPPDYQWVRDNLPNAYVLARDWALSEQHDDMLRDPVGTGQRHAREWNEKQKTLGFDKKSTFILGINEPKIWEAGVPEALSKYTVALCDEASKYELMVGAMQLSVGWPNNTGPNTAPDWSIFPGVEAAIQRGNHILICHEYWANNGPAENWGWWAGRSLKCPWNVAILIGECGIDMFVKDTSVGQQRRGWIGNVSADRYAADLDEYVNRMGRDPRFVGCCVFASDFQAHEWYSFDLAGAYDAIIKLLGGSNQTPYTLHLPLVLGEMQYDHPTAVVDVPAGANIRTGPGVDYDKIGAEPQGTPLVVIGRDGTSLWWKVDSRFGEGWVSEIAVQTHKVDDVPIIQMDDTPPPQGDNYSRAIEFVLGWEGGLQKLPWDAGNWTGCAVGQGELKGTNFGISACSYPNLDIEHLTEAQAREIYRHDYWDAIDGDNLPWPLALVMFDTAVLHGVGSAKSWNAKHKGNIMGFVAERLQVYVQSSIWDKVGNAWVRRVADLLQKVAE